MRLVAGLTVALLFVPAAFADGKFYVREEVAADVPYQRAVLFFDGEREALVLQSKYEIREGDPPPAEIQWVVPVPSLPEVGAFEEGEEDQFFWIFDRLSAPRAFRISAILTTVAGLLSIALFFGLAVRVHRRRPKEGMLLLILAILWMVTCGLLAVSPVHLGQGGGGVEVIAETQTGVYDVRVVRAEDGAGLAAWLTAEGFGVAAADREVLGAYARRGFCFVTARVRPAAREEAEERIREEGLAPALVLAFDTPQAFYPLALTAAGGGETEVVLWVVAPHRMDPRSRLRTLFAGEREGESWGAFMAGSKRVPEVLRQERWPQHWLTKLKGRLTAEEMREDLILQPAETDEPRRETVFRW